MAIINITPDSFSDGGEFLDIYSILNRASDCIKEGAQILDVGAQSTRPGAYVIGPEEELRRITPALKAIKEKFPNILISVDTFSSAVAENALKLGVNWINDISGGRNDSDILNVVSDFKCPYVITHSRGNSRTMNQLTTYNDVVLDVINELRNSIDKALGRGIQENKIIIDPGIGFAKNTQQNIEILKRLEDLRTLGFPILIGASRKRFIGEILEISNPKQRIFGTASVVSRCVAAKIDVIRAHDIKEMSEVIKMSEKIS